MGSGFSTAQRMPLPTAMQGSSTVRLTAALLQSTDRGDTGSDLIIHRLCPSREMEQAVVQDIAASTETISGATAASSSSKPGISNSSPRVSVPAKSSARLKMTSIIPPTAVLST